MKRYKQPFYLEPNFNAKDYLQRVINKWTAFCKSHKAVSFSIKQILDENEHLRQELNKFKIGDD